MTALGVPALGSTWLIKVLMYAPMARPRLLPPWLLALAVVVVGETLVAWSVIDLTLALRASSAVTISRLTPTAIAAPTPAEAPTDLPFAVVVIVVASLASMSSNPGTTSVVVPDCTSASVWFPEKATETAAAAVADGMSAPALLIVVTWCVPLARTLIAFSPVIVAEPIVASLSFKAPFAATEAPKPTTGFADFAQRLAEVRGHVRRLHQEQAPADRERGAVADCRRALAGTDVDRERTGDAGARQSRSRGCCRLEGVGPAPAHFRLRR